MRLLKALSYLAAALVFVPCAAFAEYAYPVKDVSLRAGPSTEYPVVMRIRARVPVDVIGCLSDYRWCDVVVGPNRGWVYSGSLVYPYQGNRVPILSYGSALGIGIVGFVVGSYWDQHYRGRSWYHQRQHWVDRHDHRPGPGVHRPPPPPPAFRPEPHRPVHPAPAFRPEPPRPAHPTPVVRPEVHRPVAQPAPVPRPQVQHQPPAPNRPAVQPPAARPQVQHQPPAQVQNRPAAPPPTARPQVQHQPPTQSQPNRGPAGDQRGKDRGPNQR